MAKDEKKVERRLINPDDILKQDGVIQLFNTIAQAEGLLPIKVTPHYQGLIDEEVSAVGYDGPLYKTAYPTADRVTLRAPGEVPDFVDDHDNMPPNLKDVGIRKYDGRMLFFPTDLCAGHCQYCFRTALLTEEHAADQLPKINAKLDEMIAYLNAHPEVKEVIFSGGDPMTVHPMHLEMSMRRLKEETAISDLRIHTRTIVFTPGVFRQEMCELLGKYGARVYFHITHPYEVSEKVKEAAKRLQGAGVRTYNQFPLLRGVNDHPEVLAEHVDQLDRLGIRQVSMFIPDPINYSASFRMSLDRLWQMIDTFNHITPSWINAGRVVLDTPVGKVRRENIRSWDRETGQVVFEREGKRVNYQDFPAEMDKPGNLDKMLWKRKQK